MIKELTQRLNQELDEFTNGDGSIVILDRAIQTANEITEKLYILRYKAYEVGLYTAAEAERSRQEFDLDLDPIAEKELPSEEVEKSLNEIETNEPINESTTKVEPFADSLEIVEAPAATVDIHEVTDEEVTVVDESPNTVESIPVSEPTLFHDELPIEEGSSSFDIMALIHQSKGKHEKIESFNGNYSLKEKITFINALFGGSSESFGTAVNQIDGFKTLEETYPTLEFFASTFHWHKADRQALSRFMEKLLARHA
jgi:hypothetical protein